MAMIQVRSSKKLLSPSNPAHSAMKPPMMAPAMPIYAVTIRPPGSLPGKMAFAIIPATKPSTIQAMIAIVSPLL
jgi:hypothetical protein